MDNSERRGLARPVTAGVILRDSSTQISRDSKYSNPKEWANECLQDFDDEEKEEEAEEVKEALGAEWHEEGRGHTSPAWDDGRPSHEEGRGHTSPAWDDARPSLLHDEGKHAASYVLLS